MKNNTHALRLISLLLRYPDAWLDYDIIGETKELASKDIAGLIKRFISEVESKERDMVIEDYVNTFDFGQKANLYLTYGQLKDKRERGQALVELKEVYAKAGFFMTDEELPDYLPLVLEFASLAPEGDVEIIRQFQPVLEDLKRQLETVNSPYAYLVEALFPIMGKSDFSNA